MPVASDEFQMTYVQWGSLDVWIYLSNSDHLQIAKDILLWMIKFRRYAVIWKVGKSRVLSERDSRGLPVWIYNVSVFYSDDEWRMAKHSTTSSWYSVEGRSEVSWTRQPKCVFRVRRLAKLVNASPARRHLARAPSGSLKPPRSTGRSGWSGAGQGVHRC